MPQVVFLTLRRTIVSNLPQFQSACALFLSAAARQLITLHTTYEVRILFHLSGCETLNFGRNFSSYRLILIFVLAHSNNYRSGTDCVRIVQIQNLFIHA